MVLSITYSHFNIVHSVHYRQLIHDTKPKNSWTCSSDIFITESYWIFLHVLVHKRLPSGNQSKVIEHKTKLVTFIHSWHGVKQSNG